MLDGLAPSANVLIAARALQGLGAALVSPAALSIVTTTFAEGRERTRAMGVWATIAVGGGAVGMLLGGDPDRVRLVALDLLRERAGRDRDRAARGAHRCPSRASHGRRGFDLAGAVTITGGLVVLVYGIVKAQEYGWASARTIGLLAVAAALIAAFVAVELRSAQPLVRLGILRTRSLAAGNAIMGVVAGGMFAIFFFATLYVQGSPAPLARPGGRRLPADDRGDHRRVGRLASR